MKRPRLLVGIACALVILLALVFAYPHQMIAPGALMPGHEKLQSDCFACHVALRGVSSARCMTCHKPADIGIRTTDGRLIAGASRMTAFHAQLKEADCTACHSDHAANQLTARNPKTFNHTLLKPAIAGQCIACHTKPKDALHARIVEGCVQCHTATAWKPANFAHNKYFVLDRDHNVACSTCHTGRTFESYTCYGCHAHQPAAIAAEHREEGIRNFTNCVRCHRSAEGEGEGEGDD